MNRSERPDVYGADRLFAYMRLASDDDDAHDAKVGALEEAGHPVVRIELPDPHELGGEFFRWEFATAVAGSIIGINPFDQPDVEDAKVLARELTDRYDGTGALASLDAVRREATGYALYADDANRAELTETAGEGADVPGLPGRPSRSRGSRRLRGAARLRRDDHRARGRAARDHVPSSGTPGGWPPASGSGPVSSTRPGRPTRADPNTGVFLQITCDDTVNLAVPGHRYSFGVVKEAEARSDLDVLAARGRRVLRLHLGADVGAGLERLAAVVPR